jgi:hypothetical protein
MPKVANNIKSYFETSSARNHRNQIYHGMIRYLIGIEIRL